MRIFLAVILCVLINHALCNERRTVKMPVEVTSHLVGVLQPCLQKAGAGPDTLLLIYEGGYRDDKIFKDFIFCCYKDSGFLELDDHINQDKVIRIFKTDTEIVEGVKRCGKKTGKNPKEALFKFYKCFQDTVPIMFSM